MPSLEDFREKLKTDTDAAMTEYAILIDAESLDYTGKGTKSVTFDEFKEVEVAFEYRSMSGKNIIYMSAAGDGGGRKIWYLPWKNASCGAVAKATLDGSGPPYFLTSQLDGCRFTFQYHGSDRKKVTVLHLAGDYGGSGTDGSAKRDELESKNLPVDAKPKLKRRFSIGYGKGKGGKLGAAYKLTRDSTSYYDGGMGTVFGYRNNAGAWVFYGLDIDRMQGKGLFNLGSGKKVTGSININAEK